MVVGSKRGCVVFAYLYMNGCTGVGVITEVSAVVLLMLLGKKSAQLFVYDFKSYIWCEVCMCVRMCVCG